MRALRAWSCSICTAASPRPALGHIDDALEGQIVGRLRDDAQISQRIADFGALVEARPADDAIGQAELDEALFEFAHLERGPHQNGDFVERMVFALLAGVALQLLDFLADRAGFLFGIPAAGDLNFFAQHVLGAQRLAEAAFVMGDQLRSGGENMAGASIVALKPDDLGAGKVMIEAQNVIDLGAAPAIDRLVVIADAADVFLRCHSGARRFLFVIPGRGEAANPESRGSAMSLDSGSDPSGRPGMTAEDGALACDSNRKPQILRDIRVLILVDQNIFEALLILPKNIRVLAEQADTFQKKIAEVGGVECFETFLVRDVELLALAIGEAGGFAGRNLVGRQPAVFPAVQNHRKNARRPAFFVELFGFQYLLDEADLVVDVQNREIRLQADHFGVAAQDFHANRMERAHPRHALDHLADHLADAVLHLARRLVGEGDGQDLARMRAAEIEDVGDARGQNAGFSGSRAGQHQDRPVQGLHCFPLLGIEVAEIGRAPRSHGARGYAPRGGNRLIAC